MSDRGQRRVRTERKQTARERLYALHTKTYEAGALVLRGMTRRDRPPVGKWRKTAPFDCGRPRCEVCNLQRKTWSAGPSPRDRREQQSEE